MRPFTALTHAELRLFLRNPTAIFMAVLLPTCLLLLQGFVLPGTTSPISGEGSLRLIDYFVPIAFAVAITGVAITNYPSAVSGYRESGVLRRLDVAPVGAHRVLFAQWAISASSLLISFAVTALLARVAFNTPMPTDLLLASTSLALGSLAMMAVGSLIAATAATAQIAYGAGLLVFVGCLFTAGVWAPGPLTTETVRDFTGLTPVGAMTQALTAAWYGGTVEASSFAVMAGWALVCGLVAIKIFRWR